MLEYNTNISLTMIYHKCIFIIYYYYYYIIYKKISYIIYDLVNLIFWLNQ